MKFEVSHPDTSKLFTYSSGCSAKTIQNDLSKYYDIGEPTYIENTKKYEFKTYSCPNGAIKTALNVMNKGIGDISEINNLLRFFNRYSAFISDFILSYSSNGVFLTNPSLVANTKYLLSFSCLTLIIELIFSSFSISYFQETFPLPSSFPLLLHLVRLL